MILTDLNTGQVHADPMAAPWPRTGLRRAARAAIDTAALLRALGCQVLGCHAHQGQAWMRVRLPARTDPAARAQVLARQWRATIEWIG
jgi:hypothetical protein